MKPMIQKYAITPELYNDYGKTLCINKNCIPEPFSVGSVGQHIFDLDDELGSYIIFPTG